MDFTIALFALTLLLIIAVIYVLRSIRLMDKKLDKILERSGLQATDMSKVQPAEEQPTLSPLGPNR